MFPKPVDFSVCPFEIVVDTREQAPFRFDQLKDRKTKKQLVVPVATKGLKTGDYSITGCEERIAIERKSLGDFLNCCGNDRERFEEQLKRLNSLECAAVVVEASWARMFEESAVSKLKPASIHGSIVAWTTRDFPRVHWYPMPTRQLAEATAFRILERWWTDVKHLARPILE